jgi:hypothetical protein
VRRFARSAIAATAAALTAGGLIALGGAVPASAAPAAHPTTHAAGAAASAATAAHRDARQTVMATPATSGNAWADGGDGRYLYYDSSTAIFITYSQGILIGTATACDSSGDCEHKLPNGKCMEWESGPNTVSEATCSGIPRQLWSLTSVGGGYYTWKNVYATALFQQKNYCSTSGGNAAPFLTAAGTGVYMRCGLASGYGPSASQQWV